MLLLDQMQTAEDCIVESALTRCHRKFSVDLVNVVTVLRFFNSSMQFSLSCPSYRLKIAISRCVTFPDHIRHYHP